MTVKSIIDKIRKGKLKPGVYTTTNEKKENAIIVCLNDNHILVTTAQKNGWTALNSDSAIKRGMPVTGTSTSGSTGCTSCSMVTRYCQKNS